jgi:chromatin remodeling complex protein RSC6
MSSATKSPAGAKRVTKKTEEVAVAAPVAAAAPAAAPVSATKSKKAAAPAAAAAPAPAAAVPVAASAVAAEATVSAAEPEEVRLETEAKSITARLLAVRETVSELISEAKRLEKKAAKVQKLADKRRRRKVVEGEPGKPARVSIFQVPTGLTPELCTFMGRPAGSLESRSNVTKFITKYVSDNNLKNKHDINADAKLLKLLRLTKEDKLTYFNLQKYLNVHYLKTEKPTTSA